MPRKMFTTDEMYHYLRERGITDSRRMASNLLSEKTEKGKIKGKKDSDKKGWKIPKDNVDKYIYEWMDEYKKKKDDNGERQYTMPSAMEHLIKIQALEKEIEKLKNQLEKAKNDLEEKKKNNKETTTTKKPNNPSGTSTRRKPKNKNEQMEQLEIIDEQATENVPN